MRLSGMRGPAGSSFATASAGTTVGHSSTRSKACHSAAGDTSVDSVCVFVRGKAIGSRRLQPRQPVRRWRIDGAGGNAAGDEVGDLVDGVERLVLGRLGREARGVRRGDDVGAAGKKERRLLVGCASYVH